MQNIIVREAKREDIPLLWEFLKSNSDDGHMFSARVNQKISSADHHVAVAIADETVVGYAWVQDYGSHIRTGHKTARLSIL